MSEQVTAEQIESRLNEIRAKRIATLLAAYELMRSRYKEVYEGTVINRTQVVVTVEEYIRERTRLVQRHNIAGRIQRHKIAGLMAAAIVKYRPIQLIETESPAARLSMDNETLAVLHGVAVCAEGNLAKLKEVLGLQHCATWFSDFIHLLRSSPLNGDSFILIFETLSLAYFPDNLVGGS